MTLQLLPLGLLLLTVAVPVEAECDPGPAVVAVASVLSTLAVVVLVLLAIFFFRRRSRRKGHNMTRPSSSYQPHGVVNRAFSHPDDGGLSEQGKLDGARPCVWRLCSLAVTHSLTDMEVRGSIRGRDKPRTLKLELAADPPSVWHCGFSVKSGRPGVRIM
ncbi:hypothetical protein ElyMa_004558700 [Elysia marginata]|uniref:Uncharacterized protein n=1 Tax=Elysia marginata TaxID=1093978 RepID=A0AAV4HRT3_9GAST|nr:hypothetical protein ElyMa_004558700 [Elysia marginata]